ncbi:post-GPI attachment to proteins factor 6-like isoform X2 [Amphibalanus amphitrite]|uniref:post-GPI attachment to proteins factor 6-like isoform X2 n=1 Tax=Amphibalanus amphitrite TaxID=1232801 RepID=UPI001C9221F8|nr:post-GPI attachment to proteins factor 6-like isoform X2 [Amphibalanus amphitrite]
MHLMLQETRIWLFLEVILLVQCSLLSGLGIPTYQKLSPRELFKYRSYKDVQLFHFQVPAQMAYAKFAFRANETDSRCDPKNVTIYLQHGSYPVVSPLGAQFPDNFHLARTSLTGLSARSDSTWLRYTEEAPLAGDWFVAAFTLYDDTRITQKGLGPSCHTVLESEARLEPQEGVITLVPEVTAHQRLILMHKINATQYYRFVVPEGTFSAVVNVSKCVEAGGGGPCPLAVSASPLALPTDGGPLTSSVNCSSLNSDDNSNGGSGGGVCLLTLDTVPNRWHYVRLELENGTAAQFGIQIVLQDGCEGSHKENEYMLVSEMRCQSPARTAFIPVLFAEDSTLGNHSCDWDRVPLGRQSLAGSLAFIYDQLPDPVTTKPPARLNITTERPTYMTFEVQPVQDIGGTLTVALTLPSGLNTSLANVSVTGCLSHFVRARVLEDGSCSSGVRLTVNTTTFSSGSGSDSGGRKDNITNLPYPEPGDWYLTLAVRCYLQQEYGRETPLVPCPENQTSLIFHIESAPCLQASCGANGACYQYFSGGFVFSTCVCWAGYGGWGCTDSSRATPDFQLLLATLLLTISNVLFVPAVLLALRRRYFTEAFVYAFAMFFSTFYHACDEEKYVFCLMRLSVMQFCDFYAGIFAFWVTLVCMADLAPAWSSLMNVGGAMLVALGVEYDRTGLWVFVVPVATAFVCMVSSWVYHCRRQRALYPSLRYLLLGLLPGATVAGVGLVCYALLETEENYKYTHSAWHCCIAVSILFLLPPRRPQTDSYSPVGGAAGGAAGGSGSSTGKLLRVTAGGSQQTVNTSSDSERGVADGHR